MEIMLLMKYRWESFLIIQEEQEAELLNQVKEVGLAQVLKEAGGAHYDLKFPDCQKAFR